MTNFRCFVCLLYYYYKKKFSRTTTIIWHCRTHLLFLFTRENYACRFTTTKRNFSTTMPMIKTPKSSTTTSSVVSMPQLQPATGSRSSSLTRYNAHTHIHKHVSVCVCVCVSDIRMGEGCWKRKPNMNALLPMVLNLRRRVVKCCWGMVITTIEEKEGTTQASESNKRRNSSGNQRGSENAVDTRERVVTCARAIRQYRGDDAMWWPTSSEWWHKVHYNSSSRLVGMESKKREKTFAVENGKYNFPFIQQVHNSNDERRTIIKGSVGVVVIRYSFVIVEYIYERARDS